MVVYGSLWMKGYLERSWKGESSGTICRSTKCCCFLFAGARFSGGSQICSGCSLCIADGMNDSYVTLIRLTDLHTLTWKIQGYQYLRHKIPGIREFPVWTRVVHLSMLT
jgi:hypothetical protein